MLGVCSSAVNSSAYYIFFKGHAQTAEHALFHGVMDCNVKCLVPKSNLITVLIGGLGQITIFTNRSILAVELWVRE